MVARAKVIWTARLDIDLMVFPLLDFVRIFWPIAPKNWTKSLKFCQHDEMSTKSINIWEE